MNSVSPPNQRVITGMRPTGRLHLGHYHGVLKNLVELQNTHECYFFVADLHALTTHYESPDAISQNAMEMVIDWLAAGVNPSAATLFVQSWVPQHAEMYTFLSMITPLGWLERVPTFKDQQENLKDRDLATHGFLGYPVLMSADILLYRAGLVPVGEDQIPHLEICREMARRFNHLYGREKDFEERAEKAITKMGKKNAKLYRELRRRYQENGDGEALEVARALLEAQQNISVGDQERLYGYLEGGSKIILPEPQALLTEAAKMPGLDGRKMSKSYGNTITLREDPVVAEKKISKMQTDTARVKRSDPGEPERCPVWQWHLVYSSSHTKAWVQEGCRSAQIGCLDCKRPIIEAVVKELNSFQERAAEYESDPVLVKNILNDGSQRAREEADDTMDEVREAMGLNYRG